MSPVKSKRPRGSLAARRPVRHPPQVEAESHVVRAAVVGHDVRHLERRVELVPVRPRGAKPAERADVDRRDARIVVADVAVEAGNAEVGARCRDAAHREGIQGVEIDPVIADPEVVVQVRPQRVRIGEQRVLVDTGLRDHLDRNRRWRNPDVVREAVVPVVAEIQASLVADVLIDAEQDLVDVVVRSGVGLQVRRRPRLVCRRVVLQQLARDRRNLRLGDDVAGKRLAGQRVFDGGGDFGKVPLAHQRGRHGNEAGRQARPRGPLRTRP